MLRRFPSSTSREHKTHVLSCHPTDWTSLLSSRWSFLRRSPKAGATQSSHGARASNQPVSIVERCDESKCNSTRFFSLRVPGDCQVLSAGFYWSVIGHRDRQCQTLLVASLWINRRSRQLVTWEKKTKKILAGYFPSLFFVSLIFLDWHNRGIVEACMELWSVVVLSVQSFWHAVWE